MKIKTVTIRFEKLISRERFSNEKAVVELTAELEPKDDPALVREHLFAIAKYAVDKELGIQSVFVTKIKTEPDEPQIEI